MDGFETVMLQAENDSWGIYHLVPTEEIKENTATSENTVDNAVVNDVEKIKVTFEKPSMFTTNYLRLNKIEQNKKWLESLENETANVRTQSGKEIKKESLENTSGYKVDLYDFTISMRNMEIGELIEIETDGYDKVVLKIVRDSFGSARLEIYE